MNDVNGNGGAWTLNMPENIQSGGAGKGHWAAKQAEIEEKGGS